ncbi:serine/threonine protein kinase [Marinisporobacter balticus]|uniref:Serine/threonine-protein kinase n=1 Tax=Marinisporobacter balticus TaxID=2018667 RepID=A0A4R2KXE1_9FIRM|nr:protein kinase [Marinisporobacter balticus]TCO71355.1 serine/threonine-protein kinase [Marinisporobacter balticus]
MNGIKLYPGDILWGKWNKNGYKIIHLLGMGGIGKVFKVQDIKTNQICALKISKEMQSITKEYEMLNKFDYIGLVPKVYEIDDFYYRNDRLYYIAMECIEGKNLKEYIMKKPVNIKATIGLTMIIGKAFRILHKNGFIFGDLKLENLMIDQKNNVIKIIDLGGVTAIGSSIKEFTPLYDRASWNMGLRRGDEKYDLFSLSMLITTLLLQEQCSPQEMTVDKLIKKMKDMHIFSKLVELIHKGFKQKDISFEEFLIHLEKLYRKDLYQWKKNKKYTFDKKNRTVNVIFISSILLFVGILYKCF